MVRHVRLFDKTVLWHLMIHCLARLDRPVPSSGVMDLIVVLFQYLWCD
ncbi:hypothetical protein HanLR1_Chr10g0357901 [Helianthus annuus]|nr:hypothetical protein HanLR1_Chr10g0357901 [Helianthus annuus]